MLGKMKGRFDYTYRIDECDILDKSKGEAFRQKRRIWLEWLNGEDSHSISRQIYSMLRDHALFCVVNELRRIAATEPEDGIGFNGSVIRLFDTGFVTTQATTIRRLIEKPKASPKWAVISIRRVLKDITDNLSLLTRENFVCYDGLPYDYEQVHKRWLSSLPATENGIHCGSLPVQGPDAWVTSEQVHKHFDILAQTSPHERTREDTVRPEVLGNLESQIKKCDHVKTYVDKFIAHAAAPETRADLQAEERAITLERLEGCYKTLYQIASFMSGALLWESSLGGLPVPQFDHLKDIEKRWVSPKNIGKAREAWRVFEKEVSEWDSALMWPESFLKKNPTIAPQSGFD